MRDSKKIVILSALIIVVLLLGIGFAAFSSSITISSSATVKPDVNTFKVVFSNKSDSVDVSDVKPTLDPTTITASNGVIDNTTNPTLTNLRANFTSPGQKVVYNLYVYNAGEYTAYLNSITLKGNKTCTPGNGATVSLVGQACEDIKVTVKVGSITTSTTLQGIPGETIEPRKGKEVQVIIEYINGGARADGPFSIEFNDISLFYATVAGQNEEYIGESGPLYTGEIYRSSNFYSKIGDPITGWCIDIPGVVNSCVENDYSEQIFNTKESCEEVIQLLASYPEYAQLAAYARCVKGSIEYETDVTNISTSNYLKHEVVNNVITASYACITYTENGKRKEACVRGGDSAYYASNQAILHGVEGYFNTLDFNNVTNNFKGYCDFIESYSSCYSDSLYLNANSGGDVHSNDGSWYCDVYSDGRSNCS